MTTFLAEVPTTQGQRDIDELFVELFALALNARTDLQAGVASVTGDFEGEQIELRVTVRAGVRDDDT
jgi:hypothetical protein